MKVLRFLLLFSAFSTYAQEGVPGDSVLVEELINTIESESDYQFQYRQEWLKDQYVSLPDVSREDMDTFLSAIFSNTAFSFWIDDVTVILVKDSPIIKTPKILNAIKEVEDDANLDKGYVFAREYQQSDTRDPEQRQYEIGSRNLYENGKTVTIAGYVTEEGGNTAVEDAFVFVQDPFLSTSTGADGFFTLKLPAGKHTLQFQSLNMKNTFREVLLLSDGRFDVEMEVDVIALNAVTVDAGREVNVKSAEMGITRIDIENIKVVPALLGERDIVKVATTNAGIQFLGEGAAGINIRGGKADQNLFLIDGAPIYNTNHFFGFFTVFNPETVAGLDVYKSAIPADFGGRLSSVFDIKAKVPDKEKISGSGGIGPVTSTLMFEGPIFENGPSLLIGGRANYSDFVLDQLGNSSLRNNDASFFDITAKLHHEVGKKDEFSLLAYYSRDKFLLSSDTLLSFSEFSYNNLVLSGTWHHHFNDRLKLESIISTSQYGYDISFDELASQAFDVVFDLKENSFSTKLDGYVNDQLSYKTGITLKHFQIAPGEKTPSTDASLVSPDLIAEEQALETALFGLAQYSPRDNITISGGLRYNIFNALGPGREFVYHEFQPRSVSSIVDTLQFGSNEVIKTYHGPEFRLSGRYSLSETASVKASYNRTRQNIHLLLNAASIAPNDTWRLSNTHIRPQVADQFSIGYYRNFYGKQTIETSAELYYKDIQDLVDFKVGTDLQFNQTIETGLLQGDGRTYGLELSIKKKGGWVNGWINYTFSRSLIRLQGDFPEETINGGVFFPTGYDKPHYINSVTNYKFTRRLTFTLGIVYATGVPVTYPLGKWTFKGVENLFYADRNSFRVSDYFRTDLGINIEGSHKVEKLAHSSWTFSIYNVLGRDNVYSVFFNVENGEVAAYELTVFRNPIPTITYNFRF